MTLAINSFSMSDLKTLAIELNAKVEGDKRLRATWENAIAIAQSALQSAGHAIDEFTGYPLTKSVSATAKASVEAYQIAHAQFVVPVERTIAWTWNTATSERAIAFYLRSAITLMRFCFAVYRSGMAFRDWCEALVEECLESEEELQFLPALEARATEAIKRFGARVRDRIWALDARYQAAIVWVMDEARSVFSVGEWVGLIVK